MSDDLRTRIAKVLQARWSGPTPWEEKDGAAQRMYLSDADAIIRDVLTPEFLADMMIAAVQKAAADD